MEIHEKNQDTLYFYHGGNLVCIFLYVYVSQRGVEVSETVLFWYWCILLALMFSNAAPDHFRSDPLRVKTAPHFKMSCFVRM